MNAPKPQFSLGDVVKYFGTNKAAHEKDHKIIGLGYSKYYQFWNYIFDFTYDDGVDIEWLKANHDPVGYLSELEKSNYLYWSCRGDVLVKSSNLNNSDDEDRGGLSFL